MSKFAHRLSILALLVVLAGNTGCEKSDDNPIGPQGATTQAIDLLGKGQTLSVLKNDAPFFLTDLMPERSQLKALNAAGQEEYLLKRALALVLDRLAQKPEYQTKDHFTVRMVLVTQKDEYQRPRWGNAVEVGLIEIDRAGLGDLDRKTVESLTGTAARQHVRSVKLTLSEL